MLNIYHLSLFFPRVSRDRWAPKKDGEAERVTEKWVMAERGKGLGGQREKDGRKTETRRKSVRERVGRLPI